MCINKSQYCDSVVNKHFTMVRMKAAGLHCLPHEPSTPKKTWVCVQATNVDGKENKFKCTTVMCGAPQCYR